MIDSIGASTAVASNFVVNGAEPAAKRVAQVAQTDAGAPADFAAALARAALNAIDTMKAGEATAITGVQGKASVQQVAEAVMAAEQTLQGAIAIRDKVVAAYLELSRMQI